MRKQITFEGNYVVSDAIEYIRNLKECFTIKSFSVRVYDKKYSGYTVKRSTLVVDYE